MLIQLHWQFENGTEMKAQREINSNDEMRRFVQETKTSHPLPKGATWVACNEKSKYFMLTEKKSNN